MSAPTPNAAEQRSPSGTVRGETLPVTLPISIEQYSDLVDHGHFDQQTGQTELINGRIAHINPQGPQHASPIDILGEWSIEQTKRQFWVRIEKPIVLANSSSMPEPDIAWVTRQSYAQQHPGPKDVHLLMDASVASSTFDTGEKCEIYARAGIPEYWQINIPRREVRVYRDPIAGDGQPGSYGTLTTHGIGESISPLCLPSAVLPIAILFE